MPNSRHTSLKLVRPSSAFHRFSYSSTNLMRSFVGSVELHGMTPTTRFVAVPLSDSRTLSGITLNNRTPLSDVSLERTVRDQSNLYLTRTRSLERATRSKAADSSTPTRIHT